MKIKYVKTTNMLVVKMQSNRHSNWGEQQYIDYEWFGDMRLMMQLARQEHKKGVLKR
jgi:hypothetical protein